VIFNDDFIADLLLTVSVKEFLPRDARSAKRGIAIVGRPSVRL